MAPRHDLLGSTWRRWDLHFHTPASYDYGDKTLTAPFIARTLVEAGVEVVAITDHHVMNPGFIREMQESFPDQLTVLPGIELRSQLGGSEHVHYIGIFPEDCDLAELWTSLQGKLDAGPAQVKKKGDDGFYVPIEKGCEVIRELGGIVTVHAGKKSNSIEGLSNAHEVKRVIKRDLADKYLHCLEVGNVADCEGYREIVFPHIGKELPLLLCSDNHDAKNYFTKAPMWFKADPSFLGLLQVITEPNERVFLGDEPPSVARVRENPTRFLNGVRFERAATAPVDQLWFDGLIPLNTGLVAVIGKKGSGKSALADVLGFLGNTRHSANFTFLTDKRFLNLKQGLSRHFGASCVWASGEHPIRSLAESTDPTAVETIKYIPQGFLEDVCTELADLSDTKFDKELKDVIFSHVPEEERLGCDSLDDLVKFKAAASDELQGTIQIDIHEINRQIVELESRLAPSYRQQIQSQLDQRNAEREAQHSAKPAEPKKPEADPKTQKRTERINASLAEAQQALLNAKSELDAARGEANKATRQLASLERLAGRVDNLERQYRTFEQEAIEDALELGLQLGDLVKLSVTRKPIEAKRAGLLASKTKALDLQRDDVQNTPAAKLSQIESQIKALQLELDEPNRKYQAAKKEWEAWHARVKEIEGSSAIPDSLLGLQAKLEALKGVPAEKLRLEEKRWVLCEEIIAALTEHLNTLKLLYAPVQQFIDEHPLAQGHGSLKFKAALLPEGFKERFFALVSHGRKGSFYGEKEGEDVLTALLEAAEFSSPASIRAFLDSVMSRLTQDFREGTKAKTVPAEQLKSGMKMEDLYDLLYSLSFLKPKFELTWQGKGLRQLSPGERGNLLLIFYLLIDKRALPLVIDQPEENLDNETIATMLVPWMKDAKQRRQVIMVTHNPNLAVVCDADQVVHASFDMEAGNQITYTSGALENPAITRRIIDVLEGTQPAFDKRDDKYEILNR